MSRIIETDLGRFNQVRSDGELTFLFECPGCGTWAHLNDDQWHGRAIRFDNELHEALIRAAAERDLSINYLVNLAVREFLPPAHPDRGDEVDPVAERFARIRQTARLAANVLVRNGEPDLADAVDALLAYVDAQEYVNTAITWVLENPDSPDREAKVEEWRHHLGCPPNCAPSPGSHTLDGHNTGTAS